MKRAVVRRQLMEAGGAVLAIGGTVALVFGPQLPLINGAFAKLHGHAELSAADLFGAVVSIAAIWFGFTLSRRASRLKAGETDSMGSEGKRNSKK
jgi:hypothetical protein